MEGTKERTVDLNAILKSKFEAPKSPGAGVVAIPAVRIHANSKNFYDVSNVDTLIDAILMDGLQSPLVVTDTSSSIDYVIVSGHRRFKALQQIIAAGDRIPDGKLFAAEINAGLIPCIVNHYSSDMEAELALIRANSDTRVLTSSEISKQAERVETLLYGLKEQGYEFPGKMRDYVAECCKVSASKLARLKVIRSKLIAPYLNEFDEGKAGAINETVAYELAQLSEDDQHWIWSTNKALGSGSAKRMADEIKNLKGVKCKDGSQCHEPRKRFDYSYSRAGEYYYMPCTNNITCCRNCPNMSNCKMLCPDCAELIKDKLAAEKAKKKEENAKIRDQVKADTERSMQLIGRMHIAMDRSGATEEDACKAMGVYYYEGRLNMPDKPTPSSAPISREHLDELCALADLCKCSTDFLLCRTDIPMTPDELTSKVDAVDDLKSGGWQLMSWLPGKEPPSEICDALVKVDIGGGKTLSMQAHWDGFGWLNKVGGPKIELPVARWYPIPEDDNGQKD